MNRNRFIYITLLLFTVLLGLASRHFADQLPVWVHLYAGDALWALMVFLLFAIIFNRTATLNLAIMAMAFSYIIEISQLYHAPWIDTLRAKPLVGLILGYGFLWSDILSYTIGIAFVFAMEKICFNR
jgi:hypothetical protein